LYQANWKSWNEWDKGWKAKKKGGKNKPPLGAPDILLTAMAIELKRIHKKDEVVVLTNDKLIARVVSGLPATCGIRAIRLTEKTN